MRVSLAVTSMLEATDHAQHDSLHAWTCAVWQTRVQYGGERDVLKSAPSEILSTQAAAERMQSTNRYMKIHTQREMGLGFRMLQTQRENASYLSRRIIRAVEKKRQDRLRTA